MFKEEEKKDKLLDTRDSQLTYVLFEKGVIGFNGRLICLHEASHECRVEAVS